MEFVSPFLYLLLIGIAICSEDFDTTNEPNSNALNTTAPKSDNSFNVKVKILTKRNQNQIEVQSNQTELIASNKSLDKLFGVDSSIFTEYMKHVDLRVATLPNKVDVYFEANTGFSKNSVFIIVIGGIREDDDFDNWIPPEDIRRDVPVYMSGFDYHNRPIWIFEFGKFNFTKYINLGNKPLALLGKYFRYLSYNGIKSQALKSTVENPVNDHFLIMDAEGFAAEYLFNPKSLHRQLRWYRGRQRYTEKYNTKIIVINVNSISEHLISFWRSVVIRAHNKLEIYGTNKAQWIPRFLKIFPRDQIPEWYGGSKEFKPLYVFG